MNCENLEKIEKGMLSLDAATRLNIFKAILMQVIVGSVLRDVQTISVKI